MRIYSQDIAMGEWSDADAVAFLIPPFDGDFPGVRDYRCINTDVWRPGMQDGLVWPWAVLPARTPYAPVKQIIVGSVDEDANCTLLAFCRLRDGSAMTQASIAGMAYSVVDTLTGIAVVDSVPLSVSDVVFDELQSSDIDARWNRAGGANFIHTLAYTAFPTPDRRYQYQCAVIETSGARWSIVAQLWCRSVERS